MNSSFSKKRHIQESNRLLETRLLGRKVLFEYDIDDNNTSSVEQELSSVSSDIQELNPQLDFSTTESAQASLDNSDVCLIGDDINGYVTKKFGQKIKEMFPDKFQEVIKTMSDSINKFIDFLATLKLGDLKTLLKNLKSKIKEGGNEVVSESLLKEFFGTSMALVSIGAFTMPALVLTIASTVLVVLVGLWLLNAILCAFNISITSKKRCRVRSFSWGQCK
jgi:hypothetical protein